MPELTLFSQISLYLLLVLIGLLSLIIWGWQCRVLQGQSMSNPDGSLDDWHQQKTHYGIAFADVTLACPVSITGIILVFLAPRWGFYLLALASFWFLWANVMTTATSLRFEKPKVTLQWIVVYPLGAVVGLAYIIWSFVHFDAIYLPLR